MKPYTPERMRIGYFGGSFDPPHCGHLAVARAARDRFALDRVLLAPTGRQPLKPDGPAAAYDDRLQMTQLLCEDEPRLEASEVDAPRSAGEPNYTVDTLRRLRENLPPYAEIFAILGADALLGLPQWRGVPELFELAQWIVVSRPGFSLEDLESLALTPGQRARLHPLDGVADPTSATNLRARLHAYMPCGEFLPHRVSRYIQRHGLYGAAHSSTA